MLEKLKLAFSGLRLVRQFQLTFMVATFILAVCITLLVRFQLDILRDKVISESDDILLDMHNRHLSILTE